MWFSLIRPAHRAAAALCGAALLLVAGCANVGPTGPSAGQVSAAFHRAVTGQDGAAACRLLNSDTAAEVATAGKTTCSKAILDEDVPRAAAVRQVQVWGLAAQVLMDNDVVFLTSAGGGWKITAAGCQAQPDQPYQCAVKGS